MRGAALDGGVKVPAIRLARCASSSERTDCTIACDPCSFESSLNGLPYDAGSRTIAFSTLARRPARVRSCPAAATKGSQAHAPINDAFPLQLLVGAFYRDDADQQFLRKYAKGRSALFGASRPPPISRFTASTIC